MKIDLHDTPFYESQEDGSVVCQICSHFCQIGSKRSGLCGVRYVDENGELDLLNYGKAVALHIDPVEKKPLFHFLPGQAILSLGTLGCNFRCANCQNSDIAQMFGKKGKVKLYEQLHWGKRIEPKTLVELARSNRCCGIAYTYNEPTIFFDYACDIMKMAKEVGLKNVWVSNGYMSPLVVEAILPYLDAINIDIKSSRNSFYRRYCGADLDPVLRNARAFVEKGIWVEITTLAIPTLSDDEKMFRDIAKFIFHQLGEHVPWHISAFSGQISWKLKHLPNTPFETIELAHRIGKEEGLRYVYGGNVPGKGLENTRCPSCHSLMIERCGYQTKTHYREGSCSHCDFALDGIWK